MYLKHKASSAMLYLACFLALGICLALIAFFVHILVLRTEYRAVCLEINDVILQTSPDELSISRGNETWPLDENTLEYYNIRLLDAKTVVYSRKDGEEDDRSIVIRLGTYRLSYTGIEDDSAIRIRWDGPSGHRCYLVRSDDVSFRQFGAYLSNYVRRLGN